MNSDINSGTDTNYQSSTVEYDDSQLATLITDVQAIQTSLTELTNELTNLSQYEKNWNGAAKDAYLDLKDIIQKYASDYGNSVEELKSALDGLQSLLGQTSKANVLEEIAGE